MSDESLVLFKEFINYILVSNEDDLDPPQIILALRRQAEDHPILKDLDIGDDMMVQLDETSPDLALVGLSILLKTVLDFLEVIVGPAAVDEKIVPQAKGFLATRSEEFSRLKLLDYLPQVLQERMDLEVEEVSEKEERQNLLGFGVKGLDELFDGGIPEGSAILVQGPAGFEKELILDKFLANALTLGKKGLAFVSMHSPEELMADLELLGTDMTKVEKENRLLVLDWYSHKHSRVVNVDVEDTIYRISQDLTNVAIATNMALKEIGPGGVMIVNILSSLKTYNGETSYNFIKELLAKLNKFGITALFSLETGMHKSEAIYTLHELFDGVIDIKREVEGLRFERELGVLNLTGTYKATEYIPFHIARDPLIKQVEFGEESDRLFCRLPGPKMPEGNSSEFFEQFLEMLTDRGASFVVEGDPGLEKEHFVSNFIREHLQKEKQMLVALSTMSPEEFSSNLAKIGVDLGSHEEILRFVDWYSWKNERISNMEIEGNITRTSQDLTHLGISLNNSLNDLNEISKDTDPTGAVLDILSPALQSIEFETIFDFLQSLRAMFRSKKTLGFFLVERNMHSPDILASLHHVLDGFFDIRKVKGETTMLFIPTRFHLDFALYSPFSITGSSMDITRMSEKSSRLPELSDHMGKLKDLEERILKRRQRSKTAASPEMDNSLEEGISEIRKELEDFDSRAMKLRQELQEKENRMERKETEISEGISELDRSQKMHLKMVDSFKREQGRLKKERLRLKELEGVIILLSSVLPVLDSMLEKLPDADVDEFLASGEHMSYQELLKFLGI